MTLTHDYMIAAICCILIKLVFRFALIATLICTTSACEFVKSPVRASANSCLRCSLKSALLCTTSACNYNISSVRASKSCFRFSLVSRIELVASELLMLKMAVPTESPKADWTIVTLLFILYFATSASAKVKFGSKHINRESRKLQTSSHKHLSTHSVHTTELASHV